MALWRLLLYLMLSHIPEKGTSLKKFIETVLIQAFVITIYIQSSTPEGTAPPRAVMCHCVCSLGNLQTSWVTSRLRASLLQMQIQRCFNYMFSILFFYFDDRKKVIVLRKLRSPLCVQIQKLLIEVPLLAVLWFN